MHMCLKLPCGFVNCVFCSVAPPTCIGHHPSFHWTTELLMFMANLNTLNPTGRYSGLFYRCIYPKGRYNGLSIYRRNPTGLYSGQMAKTSYGEILRVELLQWLLYGNVSFI